MRAIGAGDGSRTRDIQLGRLTLCQLSYSRSIRAQPERITIIRLDRTASREDNSLTFVLAIASKYALRARAERDQRGSLSGWPGRLARRASYPKTALLRPG